MSDEGKKDTIQFERDEARVSHIVRRVEQSVGVRDLFVLTLMRLWLPFLQFAALVFKQAHQPRHRSRTWERRGREKNNPLINRTWHDEYIWFLASCFGTE
jgi:hypothetical protein